MLNRVHGGLHGNERQQLKASHSDFLDLSVNINAYGPSPEMKQALSRVSLGEYPDPNSLQARRALASQFNTSPSRVALGHGASELLWSLARLLGGPQKKVFVCEPCFSEMRAAFAACSTRIFDWHAREEDEFDVDLAGLGRLALRNKVNSIYLCAPSSPAGRRVPLDKIYALADQVFPAFIVLDQSFLSLSDHSDELYAPLPQNVIAVRSLTKELGLPAVRIGYLLASEQIVAHLESVRPHWTVSTHGQVAALISTQQQDFLATCRSTMLALQAKTRILLEQYGLPTVPSNTAFCLARTERPAAQLRDILLHQHSIAVRDCASFGLPHFIRLGVRTASALERLELALGSCCPKNEFKPQGRVH